MSATAHLFDHHPDLTDYICHWSVRHGYVYVETPKVACTTIKRVLQSAELGPDRQADIPKDVHMRSQSPLLAPKNDPAGFAAAMRDPAILRFGFVRNPFTRALSCWLDKMVNNEFERHRLAPELGLDPTEPPRLVAYLEAVARQPEPLRDPHWASQTFLLCPNRLSYDFLGRFETFRSDFLKLCRHLGIEAFVGDLPDTWHATDAGAKVRTHIGETEARLIRAIYEVDFRNFGYGWGNEVV